MTAGWRREGYQPERICRHDRQRRIEPPERKIETAQDDNSRRIGVDFDAQFTERLTGAAADARLGRASDRRHDRKRLQPKIRIASLGLLRIAGGLELLEVLRRLVL